MKTKKAFKTNMSFFELFFEKIFKKKLILRMNKKKRKELVFL